MSKEVTLIYSLDVADDYATVIAIVEDARIVRNKTEFDPPEYGPGVCKAGFFLEEDEKLPDDDDELIGYLEKLELDWEIYDEYDY
jgi:hypothetical protein